MKCTIAIDLGGTIIKIGLFKIGQLVDRREIKARSASGLRAQLPELGLVIDNMLKANQLSGKDLLGIGFSFPGLVDSSKNRIISVNKKYNDGPETDLVSWAIEKWNCSLYIENDTRMALLGEWQFGAGKNYRDLIMVTIGTGIGTAVLIDGQLLKGKHFQAGNLGGHFTVNYNGTKCTCGNIGCVEAEASTWRLPSLLKSHSGFIKSSMKDEEVLDFKTLFLYAGNNDPVAVEVLEHCLSVWSAGIITMIHAFDPELIILGGGIMKSASVILPYIQEKIDQLAWTPWGKVKLIEARFPDSAALYGADFLVRSSFNN